jgi:hypothetical protein
MDADNRFDQHNNFDQLLDSALRARRDADPRLGLEDRVLARLAAEPPRRFVWWPAVAVAAAAVVAIAIAVALLHLPQPERTITNRATQPANPSAMNTARLQTNSAQKAAATPKPRDSRSATSRDAACCLSTKVAAGHHTEETQLPKLATFPAPRPATAEERMLAQLAAQLAARHEFSEIANLSIDAASKDLSITELNIEPLEATPATSSPQE